MSHIDDASLPLLTGLSTTELEPNTLAHLRACPRCAHVVAHAADDLAQVALSLPQVVAPAMLRESLLHALGEVSRFSDQLEPMAERLGMERHEAEMLLDSLDHPINWSDSHAAGVQVLTIGQRTDATFVRVAPGHPLAPEPPALDSAWILQGACHDATGQSYSVGCHLALSGKAPGAFVASAGPDLVCLLLEGRAEAGPREAAQEARDRASP